MEDATVIAHLGYLASISLFVLGIKQLSKVATARRANRLAALAMLLAVLSQLLELGAIDYTLIISGIIVGTAIGAVIAYRVEMTAMPQLVACLNGFGGAASTLVALSLFGAAEKTGPLYALDLQGARGYGVASTIALSIIIGSVTFTGSILAYLKLSERYGSRFGNPLLLPYRHLITSGVLLLMALASVAWVGYAESPFNSIQLSIFLTLLSLACGILLVLPIGGADMPVVVSLLNSYSGLAASATGFALQSNVLIVSGALVGASGLILTGIMCRGMNRSLLNVMVGGFGGEAAVRGDSEYQNVKRAEPEEAALDFGAVRDVIIVPGYGLAVAQGQTPLAELASLLKANGTRVRYAIHPVAGRMPGHMNVLLAESHVPYEELFEMDEINGDFQSADIALVVGANDVVNLTAKDDPSSPLYGMPVLNVDRAAMVYVIKRSLSPGFAGIKNPLFEADNCRMLFGDAKEILEALVAELEQAKLAA